MGVSQNIKAALNASGAAPVYACRAWVNLNGTGVVAIRASGNVSSITDNALGDITVNFANALPDANYTISTISRSSNEPVSGSGGNCALVSLTTDITVDHARIFTANITANGTASNIVGVVDQSQVCVSIIR